MPDHDFSAITVMVVDDEEFTRRFVTKILAFIGIDQVVIAKNGIDALKQLTETDSRIDLVICDVEMPEMTGYEFVRRLRGGATPRFKDLPVLILTGEDNDANLRKAHIYKINGFLIKPLTANLLRLEMEKIFGGSLLRDYPRPR